MADPKAEIMMQFITGTAGLLGRAVAGQSTLKIDPTDDLSKGFVGTSARNDQSNFFEVQTFDFSMSVKPKDEGIGLLSQGVGGPTKGGFGHHADASASAQAQADKGAKGKGADAWQRWRSATEPEARRLKFSLVFDSFRITRAVDSASPLFFRQCARQESFGGAVLIKRVASGLTGGNKRIGQVFLRFEFTDVMLKGVKWSDGDIVTESTEFVCNKLKYTYLQQNVDGSLEPTPYTAHWDRAVDSAREKDDTNGSSN